jgi:hypothetical protein
MENTSSRPVSREEKAAAEMGNRLLDFIECLEARILESDIVSWQFTDLTDAAHILLLIAGPRWPSIRETTISSGFCWRSIDDAQGA